MENLHKTLYLKVTALTPVHVGVEAEKHWRIGLDAVWNDGSLYILDSEKLWARAAEMGKEDAFLLHLAKADVQTFIDAFHIPLHEVSIKIYKASGKSKNPIRPFMRSQGRLVMPGSSLKGAITSSFLHYLGTGQSLYNWEKLAASGEQKSGDEVFHDAFGRIENNLLRFLQVGDGYFSKSELTETQIQTVNTQTMQAAWKGESFNTYLECITPGDSSVIRLNFAETSLKVVEDTVKRNEEERRKMREQGKPESKLPKKIPLSSNYKTLYKTDRANISLQLLSLFSEYSRRHLEREKKYFEAFQPDGFPTALNRINELLELIQKGKTIVRLGMGSGFHAMTGDWRFTDHVARVTKENDQKETFRYGKPITLRTAQKTRKLAYSKIDEDVEYQPMGFVLLELVEEKDYLHHLTELDHKEASQKLQLEKDLKAAQEHAAQKAEEMRLQKDADAAQEKARQEELRRPKYKTWPEIKDGVEVDAVIIGSQASNPKIKKFKILIGDEGKEPILEKSYFSGQIDEVYIVRVKREKQQEKLKADFEILQRKS